MLRLENITHIHSDRELLFSNINLTVANHEKVALIGNNGAGKSTLLQIIAGAVQPHAGPIITEATPYLVPQHFGQYNDLSIAQALGISEKLAALQAILAGDTKEKHFDALQDDWTIETRCFEALQYWQLDGINLHQPLAALSGGQKTKVFLAGIAIHQAQLVLLDEPSNHLDAESRQLLYRFIELAKWAAIVVSHDKKLLNLFPTVCELNQNGIKIYGGNFDFYTEQKALEVNALSQEIESKEKALHKAKEKQQETLERQQKLNSRGKGKQEKSGVARIMMNTLRNNAENSTSKLKSVHAEKIDGIAQELQQLRATVPDIDGMKLGFNHSGLHKGKVLFASTNINFAYDQMDLWQSNLNVQLLSGERVALKGSNGSGKTTLIKLILGELVPLKGSVHRAESRSVYIDQDYSLLDNSISVYEQAQRFNTAALQEHEVKIRLNRFLFGKEDWDKPCSALSGGERMRLMLCCLTLGSYPPDLIILDEPTNNLDLANLEILTAAINQYRGTLLVVSHDESFLEQLGIERTIML